MVSMFQNNTFKVQLFWVSDQALTTTLNTSRYLRSRCNQIHSTIDYRPNYGSTQHRKRRPEGRRRVYARAVSGCRGAGSPVELRGHKGYGNQRDCGGNHIYLHLAEPCQCLQAGVTQEENRHQSNHQFVHVCLRYHLLFRWFYLERPTTRCP